MIKLIPNTIGKFVGGKFYPQAPVVGVEAFPPGQHPAGCPLIADCHAVRVKTPYGDRWIGAQKAWITSGLRMAIELLPGQERDEVIAEWEDG